MIAGYNHLTQNQENKWIFYAAGQSWQVWEKPDGCNFIHIVVIGTGAGGGGGYQRVASATGGGGGGGAASGISTMMIPAYTIPDKLYIQVGIGGAGGAKLAAGSAGGASYVGLVPDTTNTSANILISNVNSTGGGSAGSASGGAAGSAAGIVWATPFTGWGKYINIIAGQAGQAGTGNSNFDQTAIVGGGAGAAYAAASTQVAGRSVTSSYKQPSSIAVSTSSALGTFVNNSGSGASLMYPQPQFFAGAGAAAQTSATSNDGGNGGIGCGGGGGGVGTISYVNSPSGGKGGDGLVIITAW
jgi:hypothetical protein